MKQSELKYYGLRACLSLWESRPQDIIRVYLEESHLKKLAPLLKWCAKEKKVYRIVPPAELNRISDSVHHEGVCVVAKERALVSLEEFQKDLRHRKNVCLLYLDGVQNPHNVGSILRTCAHFNVSYILGEAGKLPSLSPSCCRIAVGAGEKVRLIELPHPAKILQELKTREGFACISTSSHKGSSLYQFRFPARSILIFGSESHGILDKNVSTLSTHSLQIPGSGAVESLNVSVAAALCIGEYFRQLQ